jgi:hypothetical protein
VALKSRTFPERGAVVHAYLALLKTRLDAAGIGAPLPRQLVELVEPPNKVPPDSRNR